MTRQSLIDIALSGGQSGELASARSNRSLQLFLVRHGETAWSSTGQHTGLTHLPLTTHGEDEARALAPRLHTTSFARIPTSQLRRESPADIEGRADRMLGRLRALSGNGALFSHGQFGAALGARWIGLGVGEAQHLALDPASLSILGYESGHPTVPVISLWNAVPTFAQKPAPSWAR